MSKIQYPLLQRRQALRLFGAGLIGCASLPLAMAGSIDPREFERQLEKLLKARPELVRDALNTLEQREAAAKLRSDRALLNSLAKQIYSETGATVLGNPAGDVTLVEFSDYRCGYCKRLSGQIEELIKRDGQLRVLVKHMPILGAESIRAAQMVLSLPQGETARQMHQVLMAAPNLNEKSLQEIGNRFQVSPGTPVAVNQQLREVGELSERLRIEGTPALVIGETLIRGAVDLAQLEHLIRDARQSRQALQGAGKGPALKLAGPAPTPTR